MVAPQAAAAAEVEGKALLPGGETVPERKGPLGLPTAFYSGTSYCCASTALVSRMEGRNTAISKPSWLLRLQLVADR